MNYKNIEFLDRTGLVKTMFTTRDVCDWPYYETGNDARYERVTDAFNVTKGNIIRIKQTHSDRSRVITYDNAGEGITKEESVQNCDGTVTSEKGLVLCTVVADCVPVFILDPVNKAVAMVHSGWRGTASQISVNTLKLMEDVYGTKPQEVLVALGPHISAASYEVSEDLIEPFSKNYDADVMKEIFTDKENGKYYLNLSLAIKRSVMKAGVAESNFMDVNIDTLTNTEYCSWRRDQIKTERILTAIVLV